MALTEADLDNIEKRAELAAMRTLEKHQEKFHQPEAAACEARASALHVKVNALKDRVDKAQWLLGGAVGLVLLPWKKLAALIAALKGM